MPRRSTGSSLARRPAVSDYQMPRAERDRIFDDVARGPWNRRHDRAIRTEQQVEHARLARVGLADDRGAHALPDDPPAREAVVQFGQIGGEPIDFADQL